MQTPAARPGPPPLAVAVAYDGSPAARRALMHAADLVGHGGKVTVINVIPAQSVSARLETVSDSQRARQRSLLREAQILLSRQAVEVSAISAVGDPAAEILTAAEEDGARILVVGRGSSRTSHLLRGSLSSKLVRTARCDVLVVH